MNSNNLSPRLKIVASLVPKGSKIADIGSDHAYLAINLIKNEIAISAIAGEVAAGPLSNSKEEIEKNDATKQIEARLGDGLAVIQDTDAIDVICIAGMGGQLIRKILNDGKTKLSNVKKLILQPNVGEAELRDWLINNGFKITYEDIVAEDHHLYEIIVAEPGEMNLSEKEQMFGPMLMKSHNDVYTHKWQRELKRLRKIEENLKAHPHHGQAKLDQVTKQINYIKEMFEYVS
jgi:tRNA (adenine22-N1)-methyltransferase